MKMSYTKAAKAVLMEHFGWPEDGAEDFVQRMVEKATVTEKKRWLAGWPPCKTLKDLHNRLSGYGENPESMKFERPLDVWVIKKPDSTFRLQIKEVRK